jgi:hypothetical protein
VDQDVREKRRQSIMMRIIIIIFYSSIYERETGMRMFISMNVDRAIEALCTKEFIQSDTMLIGSTNSTKDVMVSSTL